MGMGAYFWRVCTNNINPQSTVNSSKFMNEKHNDFTSDGTRYDGAFVNGYCSGIGVMRFSDGAK